MRIIIKTIVLSGLLYIAAMLLVVLFQGRQYGIEKNALHDNAMRLAENLYTIQAASYEVLDEADAYNTLSYIYKIIPHDAQSHDQAPFYLAISYSKHPILPRYKHSSYTDYQSENYIGVLLVHGTPFEMAYHISNYKLEYADRILSMAVSQFIIGLYATLVLAFFLGLGITKKIKSAGVKTA